MIKKERSKLRGSDRAKAQGIKQPNEVATALRDKILEGIDRTIHLVGLVPADRLDWSPAASSSSSQRPLDIGYLLGHLLDSAAGFCAVLFAAYPDQLREFVGLRELQVNHFCEPSEAATRLREYSVCISQGFEFCNDEDLGRKIPTVFASSGEPLITLLLGNLEHLTNHKYQLFLYLKQLGVSVNSHDLYQFRADLEKKSRG